LVLSVTHALARWYRYDTPQHQKIIWGSGWVFFCVSSSDQAAVPAPSFNPVLKLIFWMRCHGPIVNRVKIRGHIPPMVGWEQKMSTKAGRGGGGRGEPPPFCLARGEWKKNVSHRVNRWPFFSARRDNDQWFSCWNTTFLSVRKIVATQTFISSSGKNKLFKKTDPCFFKDNYFLKNLYWFFLSLTR
jgi:hypothetical protein